MILLSNLILFTFIKQALFILFKQQAKFKDILGKDNQGKKIKKIKNIPKMNHQKRAKVMIEMQKRIKRLGKSL
jgi:hypothetical protein